MTRDRNDNYIDGHYLVPSMKFNFETKQIEIVKLEGSASSCNSCKNEIKLEFSDDKINYGNETEIESYDDEYSKR